MSAGLVVSIALTVLGVVGWVVQDLKPSPEEAGSQPLNPGHGRWWRQHGVGVAGSGLFAGGLLGVQQIVGWKGLLVGPAAFVAVLGGLLLLKVARLARRRPAARDATARQPDRP